MESRKIQIIWGYLGRNYFRHDFDDEEDDEILTMMMDINIYENNHFF